MTQYRYFLIAIFALIPLAAKAQSLQSLFTNIPAFFDTVLIPFLFGIAFLIFVINIIRYFVIEADNKDARENAKSIAFYSVGAFVFLIIFLGIVNLLVDSSGLEGEVQPCPDYLEGATGGC